MLCEAARSSCGWPTSTPNVIKPDFPFQIISNFMTKTLVKTAASSMMENYDCSRLFSYYKNVSIFRLQHEAAGSSGDVCSELKF